MARVKKKPADPYEYGVQSGMEFADGYMNRLMNEGYTPVGWPSVQTEVPAFINAMTPHAMKEFEAGINATVTGPTAFPAALFQGVEQGFRLRFNYLVLQSLG